MHGSKNAEDDNDDDCFHYFEADGGLNKGRFLEERVVTSSVNVSCPSACSSCRLAPSEFEFVVELLELLF